jgi:hypothetical protein
MFEWLEAEILKIRTPGFHQVDGPVADPALRDLIDRSGDFVPASYKEFILKFGTARLYRSPRSGSYAVTVYRSPVEMQPDGETSRICLGNHDGATVFVESSGRAGDQAVHEAEGDIVDEVADTFEQWLRDACALAKSCYTEAEWAGILAGPRPFDDRETAVIEARRRILWTPAGLDGEGNHLIAITNNSNLTLPVYTLGVRTRDRRLNGAVFLKIGHIGPGESGQVTAGCYKEFITAEETVIFDLPEPLPETREQYRELDREPPVL